MVKINCVETIINKDKSQKGVFIIEPLEIGQGITLGNSLRRVLLSDLTNYAITSFRLNNLNHEFSIIEGVREDILEIVLNLKEIIFKSNFSENYNPNNLLTGFLQVKGPIIVTAGLFNLPENILKIINPSQYICTILDDSEFYLEVDINRGKGYNLSNENRQVSNSLCSKTFPVDAIYMPIKKVNFKVKLIHDSYGNIKESLNLEIITN